MRLMLAAVALLASAGAHATTTQFNDFSSTDGLQINGDAAVATDSQNRSVLRLTPALNAQSGSAFSTNKVSFGSDASFSAAFAFNFSNYGGAGGGADGIVFTLQTTANNVGSQGGGIGYSGLANSIGVKFDTFLNDGDLSDNFVGVVENGNIVAVPGTAKAAPYTMKSATDLYAWIDYDGSTNDLQVRMSNTGDRPTDALIDFTVNVANILGSTSAYAGFTSATGGGYENHDIVDYTLNDSYNPVTYQQVPEPDSLALTGVALVGIGMVRRRRQAA